MTTKLQPVIVTDKTLGDVAFDGTRRRPVVAINEKGELVLCCRRTATKNGWEIEGTLFKRERTTKKDTATSKKAASIEEILE